MDPFRFQFLVTDRTPLIEHLVIKGELGTRPFANVAPY